MLKKEDTKNHEKWLYSLHDQCNKKEKWLICVNPLKKLGFTVWIYKSAFYEINEYTLCYDKYYKIQIYTHAHTQTLLQNLIKMRIVKGNLHITDQQ